MNKKYVASLMMALTMIFSLPVLAQQDKKAEKARAEIKKDKQDLKEAKADSAADYHKFVADARLNISENKKSIDALKHKKIDTDKAANDTYNKKVLALERKNQELEKKIDGSEHTKTDMWSRFKLNFERDMQKLNSSIKNI